VTEKGKIDPELHEHHHIWLEEEIKEKKQCRENRQKILVHVLGWGAVSMITGLGYLAVKMAKSIFMSVPHI
jgi:hypothetical protein